MIRALSGGVERTESTYAPLERLRYSHADRRSRRSHLSQLLKAGILVPDGELPYKVLYHLAATSPSKSHAGGVSGKPAGDRERAIACRRARRPGRPHHLGAIRRQLGLTALCSLELEEASEGVRHREAVVAPRCCARNSRASLRSESPVRGRTERGRAVHEVEVLEEIGTGAWPNTTENCAAGCWPCQPARSPAKALLHASVHTLELLIDRVAWWCNWRGLARGGRCWRRL